MITDQQVQEFFDNYSRVLLARDQNAAGRLYAIPSLTLFPQQSLVVQSEDQTAGFFAASWQQYDGVSEAQPTIAVMGRAPASVWADVTWSYDGQVRERFCYQLAQQADGALRIAVLTPIELAPESS